VSAIPATKTSNIMRLSMLSPTPPTKGYMDSWAMAFLFPVNNINTVDEACS